MPALLTNYRIEWMKMRRTGVWFMLLGMAALLPVLIGVASILEQRFDPSDTKTAASEFFGWVYSGASSFFYPLFLVLVMSRLVYIENKNDTWKLIETQPVRKANLFLSKYLVAASLAVLFPLSLGCFTALLHGLLQLLQPGKHGAMDMDVIRYCVAASFHYWICSLGMLAIQYLIGLTVRSMGGMLGIGIGAVILGSITAAMGKLPWWPYLLTSKAGNATVMNFELRYYDLLSLVFAFWFLILAYLLYIKKGWVQAFFRPVKPIAGFVVLSALCIWGLSFIVRPSLPKPYGKGIVAGSGFYKGTKVRLMNEEQTDTVRTTRVDSNGKFRIDLPADLKEGLYTISWSDESNGARLIYIPKQDSIQLGLRNSKANILAGGIAESEYAEQHYRYANTFFLDERLKKADPQTSFELISKQGDEFCKELNDFRSSINTGLSETFRKRKLNEIRLYEQATMETVAHRYALFHSGQSIPWPAAAKTYYASFNPNDSVWAQTRDFKNYVLADLRDRKLKDAALMDALDREVSYAPSHDQILLEALRQRLPTIPDSTRQEELARQGLAHFKSAQAAQQLVAFMTSMKMMRHGQPAPDFTVEDNRGKVYHLSDFAGKNLVIDLWASWCMPCRVQEPYFAEMAEKYTNEELAFISISLDEEKENWKESMLSKEPSAITQYYAGGKFTPAYQVESIPRFMLISKDGKILNAHLVNPSDNNFERLLKDQIPGLQSNE